MGYKDYTIKARVEDFNTIEKKLAELNAILIGVDQQLDHYFEVARGKLKLRQGTIENLITHYERIFENGAEKTIVYRYEKNPSHEEIQRLKDNGKIIGTVKKERKIFWVNNVKIHLDELPNGQKFIELEAIDTTNQFSDNELMTQCWDVKTKLEIKDEDLTKTGYLPSR